MGLFDKRNLTGRLLSARGGQAVTASAARVTQAKAGGLKRLSQPWQQRALSYYDLVGEAWFASQFYARSLKQIRFYPALKNADGELEEITSGPTLDMFQRIQGPGGGLVEIQEQYGRLMFLTGDGYLLAQGKRDEGEVWEFVSTDELRMDSAGKMRRFTAPSGTPTDLKDIPDDEFGELAEDEAVAYRLWRRHPRYSALADSPMHAVLDLFEELMLLQMAVRSRVKSRLAGSGLLVMDDTVTFANPDVEKDDADPLNDPFLRELIAHMTAPIADEGTAAAVVPHVIRIPNPQARDLNTLIKHIKLHDPNETYRETGLRKECIDRIAIGLDMPPEILKGLADSNHWTAWAIDEQTAKAHIYPVAEQFANDVVGAYLRPAARDAGDAKWQEIGIGFDPAELVVHPDRTENAREAFDRRAIGYKAFRAAHDFKDDDAPTAEDLALMDTIDGGNGAEEEPAADNSTDEDKPDDDAAAASAAPLAPSPRYERIMGAAEFTVHRARELAGARLRSERRATGTENPDVPNDRLAHTLGADLVRPSPGDLVRGVGGTFVAAATRWGLGKPTLERLGAMIESHAAATLFEQDAPPLPTEFTALLARVERETR